MSRTLALGPEERRVLVSASKLLSGHAGYVVGGSVRDALRSKPVADLDLAVSGDSVAFARALADALDGHFVVLDAERGTCRIALDDAAVAVIDVAALQGTIEDDLARRDFTIDALAAPIAALATGEAEIIDTHGGKRDLEARTVRLVSEQALVDDPLRLLRAVRLAVQLDFEIAPQTAQALRRHAGRIGEAAAERRRDELARCFSTPRASQALRIMDDLGLLAQLFPEVTAGRGVTQPKEHYYDVFNHNMECVAALDAMLADEPPAGERERDLWRGLWDAFGFLSELRDHLREELSEGRSRAAMLKLAGLLHDVAKPETRAPDDTGRIRFFGHSDVGAETSRQVLGRLRFSHREIDFVATLIAEHLRPAQLGQDALPSRRALFRFFRDTGDAAEGVLLLSLADALAARGPGMAIEDWRQYVAYVAHVLARRHEDSTIVRPPRLVKGQDIMATLGIGPGPEVGRLLAALEEAQAAGEVATREAALGFIRTHYRGADAFLPASAVPGGATAPAAAGGSH